MRCVSMGLPSWLVVNIRAKKKQFVQSVDLVQRVRKNDNECMRSINRVTCAVGRGVIEMSEERCPAAAQRLGNVMRQGKSAS